MGKLFGLLIAGVALLIVAGACGGGNDDGGATAIPAVTSTVSVATATATAPGTTTAVATTDACALRTSIDGQALAPGQSFTLAGTTWQLCIGGAAAGSSEKLLFRSPDGGATWTLISRTTLGSPAPETGVGALPNGNAVSVLLFVSATTGFLGLTSPGENLFRSTDGGVSWVAAAELPPAVPVTSITFTSPQDGSVVTAAATWVTSDGGATWTETP